MGFPTRSHTNRPVQPQKVARGLKFQIYKVEGLYYLYVGKARALISFTVTPKLICIFVFAYAKSRFSHDAAQITYANSTGMLHVSILLSYLFISQFCSAVSPVCN